MAGNEMVERVARAIFDAENGLDGDRVGDMLYGDFRIDGPVENAREETMIVCRMAARAAIEAMREPPVQVTDAMRQAHNIMFVSISWEEQQRYDMAFKWNAGVDAALKESSQ